MSSKRSSSTPSSSLSVAIIEGNDDLLIEILLFLPGKSLIRFKVVSKRWQSLISAPSFCRRHTLHHPRRHPETQPLFILGGGGSKCYVSNHRVNRLFSFQFHLGFPFVAIHQSCNGLLLLRCRNASLGRSYYFVFNPTTLQQRDLSPLPTKSVTGIYLMFDLSLSPHYRVVCFQYTKSCTLVHLYDSVTHKWKLGAEPITRNLQRHNGIYFNGVIYFLRFGSSSYRYTPDDNLSNIPALPRIRKSGRRQKNYTMGSNGVLHFFSKQETNLLDVYETKEIENGWTIKYQVDLNPILEKSKSFHLLGMIRGENEQDSLLLFSLDGKIMVYRFYDAVFEVLVDFTIFSEENGCSFEGIQEIKQEQDDDLLIEILLLFLLEVLKRRNLI